MAFTLLLDAWHAGRRHRTPLPHGRRVGSIEHAIGGSMRPGRLIRWTQLDHDQPEHDQQDEQQDEPVETRSWGEQHRVHTEPEQPELDEPEAER